MNLFGHSLLSRHHDLSVIADPALASTVARLSKLGPQTVARLADVSLDQLCSLSPSDQPYFYNVVSLRLETAAAVLDHALECFDTNEEIVLFFNRAWDIEIYETPTRIISYLTHPGSIDAELGSLTAYLNMFYLTRTLTAV